MARKIVVQVSCDRCGRDVDNENPVELSYGGVDYRTDLCRDHADELATVLEPFLGPAERVEGRRRPSAAGTDGRSARRPTRRDPMQVSAIRTWARENGYEISDRGRIPREIEDAYNAQN